MKTVPIVCLSLLIAISLATGQATHPLSKAAVNDWAKYTVNIKNATVPELSVQDQDRWLVVSVVQPTDVRLDYYSVIGGNRTSPGGVLRDFSKPFEPVLELANGAKIDVVSTTSEKVTVKGKTYACTKIVRKVARPARIV